LKAALVELVNEQNYASVTIREITDRADIGYATFFRHYDSKDELMMEIFTEIIKDLEALPDQHGDNYFEQEGYLLFKHVSDNQALYLSILDSHAFSLKFRQHLTHMIQSHLQRHENQVANSTIPLEIAAQHMASSLLGLIYWWITNEMSYSVETMAMVYERLVIQATWHALMTDDLKTPRG
jgi:AcrR family transcriptional regulator